MTSPTQQPMRSAQTERPRWLPWSAFPFQLRFVDLNQTRIHYLDEGSGPTLLFVSAGQWSFMFRDVILRLRQRFRWVTLDFPGCGLSPDAANHDHGVPANARVLQQFIETLNLQDITMAVHDVGGPVGFLVATRLPRRFRGLIISNSFAWPLADYPLVRRMLRLVASPLFATINDRTNVLALVTATSYGVGRRMSRADRVSFLGPWRSTSSRRATQQILADVLRIDPIMSEVERQLTRELSSLPVLTLFGRKNDPYGWQSRFQKIFPHATAVGVDGHHFPFDDDPDAYTQAILAWWTRTRPGQQAPGR